VLGLGGALEALAPGAEDGGGRHPPAAGVPGVGAIDEVAGALGFGAIDEVAGALGFGAIDEVAGAPATAGLGGTEALATGAALGARDGAAAAGFAKLGDAGIAVRPVAGPGPGGGGGCTGGCSAGVGGASSRHTRASASKLRSVLRPQIGQSHPTSNRFSCASMLCAGARSRTRSRPIAKPDRTYRCSSSRASS
jgi:hypothetical protein